MAELFVSVLPTIVLCEDSEHPLANREFLFPFASVVKVDQDQIPEALGPSLVVTAITADQDLIDRLVASPNVDRLNIGPMPRTRLAGINLTKAICSSICMGGAPFNVQSECDIKSEQGSVATCQIRLLPLLVFGRSRF